MKPIAAVFSLLALAAGQAPPLQLVQTIRMPELTGGTNHLAVDAKRGRFFVTAPGEQKLIVLDLKAAKVLRVITAPSPAAARFIPDLDQLCVSGGGAVTLYDGASLSPTKKVELNSAVDELRYSSKEKRLYAGITDAAKPSIAVINVAEGKLLARIKLPAKPQGFVLQDSGDLLFANTPVARQVTVIDRKRQTTTASWPLTDAQANYPAALDEENHRLFIGCRRPSRLLVLDTDTGKIVAKVECGADADDMDYNASARRIYLACGEGVISVIQQMSPDQYQRLDDVRTAAGARNALFVPELKRFYLAVPGAGGSPAELRAYEDR